jgi:hypothetical protein
MSMARRPSPKLVFEFRAHAAAIHTAPARSATGFTLVVAAYAALAWMLLFE